MCVYVSGIIWTQGHLFVHTRTHTYRRLQPPYPAPWHPPFSFSYLGAAHRQVHTGGQGCMDVGLWGEKRKESPLASLALDERPLHEATPLPPLALG